MGHSDQNLEQAPLRMETLQVERKVITLILRENPRGRFLRIIEEVNGRRDMVVIPAAGLRGLRDALDRIIDTDESLPRPDSVLPEERG